MIGHNEWVEASVVNKQTVNARDLLHWAALRQYAASAQRTTNCVSEFEFLAVIVWVREMRGCSGI